MVDGFKVWEGVWVSLRSGPSFSGGLDEKGWATQLRLASCRKSKKQHLPVMFLADYRGRPQDATDGMLS